jgi:hypothetical protein
MSRARESIAFEVDYWRAVLADVTEINTLVGDAAGQLASAPVAMVAAMGKTFPVVPAEFGQVLDATAETIRSLERTQQVLLRLTRLIGGRVDALSREARDT